MLDFYVIKIIVVVSVIDIDDYFELSSCCYNLSDWNFVIIFENLVCGYLVIIMFSYNEKW